MLSETFKTVACVFEGEEDATFGQINKSIYHNADELLSILCNANSG